MTFGERFWVKVDKTDGCWHWTAATSAAGYGQIRRDGRTLYAHRVSYELHVGPIPAGLPLDHLCRNTRCVNPEHLEAVTTRTNILRGVSPVAARARQTHCKHGHEFTAANTYTTGRGTRRCRRCSMRHKSERRARRRAEGKRVS